MKAKALLKVLTNNPAESDKYARAFNNLILYLQRVELTEAAVYRAIAKGVKDSENRSTLFAIAEEEVQHSLIWRRYTNRNMKPSLLHFCFYSITSKLLGYTFALKLMEKQADLIFTPELAALLKSRIPDVEQIILDEERHEKDLINLLDEERLQYISSVVLGLNDALVEFTGSLAGFSFALQNNRLAALTGLIMGFSATLSMASSEYLANRAVGSARALKAAFYTGGAYLIVVALLLLPYFLLPETALFPALGFMLALALIIIIFFNYYIAVAKDCGFKKRFLEMFGISFGVAGLSFLVGLLAKKLFGIEE